MINALETGELNYLEIRKIENRELLVLVKRKSSLSKKILSKLDGKGKNINKNLQLLKDMLELIEVDLEKNSEDGESGDEEASHAHKRKAHQEVSNPIEEQKIESSVERTELKRPMLSELITTNISPKKQDDDVNFHDVPGSKELDFMNATIRSQIYQQMYQKRRKQRLEGKWNPRLSNQTQMICSIPSTNEREDNSYYAININQDYEVKQDMDMKMEQNMNENSGIPFMQNSFTKFAAHPLLSDPPQLGNNSRIPSFNPSMSKNIESATNKNAPFNIFGSNITPTGNYEIKDDMFSFEYMRNQNSTKNANGPSDFSMNKGQFVGLTNLDSANENKAFVFPSTTNRSKILKPTPSPSNFALRPELLSNRANIPTPKSDSSSAMTFFGRKQPSSRGKNKVDTFGFLKAISNDNVEGQESEISFDKNDGKIASAAEPEVKKTFKISNLQLNLGYVGDNGTTAVGDTYPTGAFMNRSPMNNLQSCTSYDAFPPNTPNEYKF